jgi:hypothetical protein
MYSTSARTDVACRCIGYIEIETGATAGEWDNAPTKIQVMGPGVKRTGDIVQTQTVIKTDTFTSTPGAATYVDVTDLTITLTMTSTLNKVLVMCTMMIGLSAAGDVFTKIMRDAVSIGVGDAASNRTQVGRTIRIDDALTAYESSQVILDTPEVAAPVYKIQVAPSTNLVVCVNRTANDTDNPTFGRGSSTLVVQEVMV